MPKKPRKEPPDKLRPDAAQIAFRVMQEATGQAERTQPSGLAPANAEAVKRGRQGGKRGGKARAKVLTPERRSEIAKKAAAARWKPSES